MKKSNLFVLPFAACIILSTSCKKDTPEEPTPTNNNTNTYTVPSTYNFSPMTYSGQTTRISMLGEMIGYMETAETPGTVLSATKLKDMFANNASPFTDAALNTSGKQLESKCFAADVTLFKSFMDSIADASASVVPGTNGTAGLAVSTADPTYKVLLSKNGFDYTMVLEKGLMGSVFYYQSMESYLCASGVGSGVDNATVVTGEGTTMEHHWDEGFGYMGVPVDFPSNTTGVVFYGEYADELNAVLGNASTIMNAFLKGRAAITNKDYTTRDAQITIVRTEWERINAAAAIHELNEAKASIADDAKRCHYLSEGYGFVLALKYKSDKVITQTQIDTILNTYFGNNFYNITSANIDNAINTISTIYGFDSIKGSL
jgi:hypothetical protein